MIARHLVVPFAALALVVGCSSSSNGGGTTGDDQNVISHPAAPTNPCAAGDEGMGLCGQSIGRESNVLYSCTTDDEDKHLLFKQCTCKGECSVGAHQGGCECQEPTSHACDDVGAGMGICGQSIGMDSHTLYTCYEDDAGKHILAKACECTEECSIGAHQGGCTCKQ